MLVRQMAAQSQPSTATPAVRLQVAVQVMFFAFLVVLLSALITTPVLLYGLGLAAHGWRWQHGALFRRAALLQQRLACVTNRHSWAALPFSPCNVLACSNPSPRSAMLASTDALAITAVLRRAGGPESLVTLMEGESLLNDASGAWQIWLASSASAAATSWRTMRMSAHFAVIGG